MPTLEKLTARDIQELLSGNAYNKAHELVYNVLDAARLGDTLVAKVRDRNVYDVEVILDPDGIYGECTCNYSWVGHCKHIGAVLLKWLNNSRSFALLPGKPANAEAPPSQLPGGVTPVTAPPATQPGRLPDWLLRPYETRLSEDRQSLKELLAMYRLDELRALARNRGWPVRGQRKDDVVEQVVDALTHAADHGAVIDRLELESRQMLWSIGLLDELQTIRLRGLSETVSSWRPFDAKVDLFPSLQRLADIGLVVYSDYQLNNQPLMTLIPAALSRAMPPFLAGTLPQHASAAPSTSFDEVRLANPITFTRGIAQLVTLIEKAPPDLRAPQPRPNLERTHPSLRGWDYDSDELVSLATSGKIRTLEQLRLTVPPPAYPFPDGVMSQLVPLVGDEGRLEFAYALLVAASLVMPGSPATVWSEVRERYSQLDEAAQVSLLARVYFAMTNWTEVWPMVRADRSLRLMRVTVPAYANYGITPQTLLSNLAVFRRMVLAVLSRLPDGTWLALDDLDSLLQRAWPQFDQSLLLGALYGSGHVNWLLTRKGEALRPTNHEDWLAAQGAFVRQIITGPLHWLGLADLGLTQGHVTHVRLNGLADLYWDRIPSLTFQARPTINLDDRPAEAVEDLITVDGPLIHVDPTRISSQGHQLFDLMARLDVAQPGRFTYRLDPAAAHQAFESGLTLPQLAAQWEQVLDTPMPEGVRAVLDPWWRGYGQVRLYQGVTIIELGDDYALGEIKATTSLEKLMIAELSPRLVVVPKSAVGRLIAELEKAGYTPKHETNE